MCSCHSVPECCVTFSEVKLSIRSFVLLQNDFKNIYLKNLARCEDNTFIMG